MIDAVVTHHRDPFRSGVARFNEVLAERLGVPLLGIGETEPVPRRPLLSFKVRELGEAERSALESALVEPRWEWELFLHEYAELPLERRLVDGARRVHCGNHEIAARVGSLNPSHDVLWAPGNMLDEREFPAAEVSVFSFGMAHKVRTDMFRRLASMLERSGRSYAVYVSAANHETASMSDAAAVFEEMHVIFPDALYFLGNLSDVAVVDRLRTSTFFAAFFEGGVRANNSSVASAMEHGAVVITNLDAYSPPELVHLENVIDIEQCDALPDDPELLRSLGRRAAETAAPRGWDALVERLRVEPC